MIKFATPDIDRSEVKRVGEAIESRWLTAGGVVREFEKGVAQVSCCDHAVAFDSCYNSMELTLRALGIGPGDEVITTPYTYTATAAAIHNTGARIVFVDLEDNGDSFEMDYLGVARAITERTKAVMPVDIGGLLCDYDALKGAISLRQELFHPSNPIQEAIGRVAIVADAAHSFGAERNGVVSGGLADFTCFSFHVLKCITTGGEGGAVVWRNIKGIDNDALEDTLRLLGDNGQTSRDKSSGWEYDIALIGHNSIMTNLDAAMGLAQLERFEEIRDKRVEVTCEYDALFEALEAVRPDVYPLIRHFGPDHTSAMHLYPIRLTLPRHSNYTNSEEYRNAVYGFLRDAGVPCNVHYKPLPMMTAYRRLGFSIQDYPRAYDMYKDLLTIPYHTELTKKEQEHIVRKIGEAVTTL